MTSQWMVKKWKEIMEMVSVLRDKMIKKHPKSIGHITITINLWDDDDWVVECRYGTENEIFIFDYKKSKDETKYVVDPFIYSEIKIDKFGNDIYVPNE